LDNGPQIVRIIPTKFPDRGGWVGSNDRMLGIGDTAQEIVLAAYGAQNSRSVFLTTFPRGKYDFISNLPSGSRETFQKAAARQFSVTARRQTMETNVLFLQTKQPNAPGLKPAATRNNSSSSNYRGQISLVNIQISSIANFLEGSFGIPVIDQTGLTGSFDIDLKWNYRNDPQHANLKQALLDQLGLELVPGTSQVEMLVVEKAN
jgi:uncharacterized protein (TIGR03435 family)